MPVLHSIAILAAFIALAFVAGAIGGQFEPGAWYAALTKPSWNPPDWVFAPVWSTLYILMGIAAWLVWRRTQTFGWPLALWVFQLVLNAAWAWLFFGLHRPDFAFAEIIVLLIAILATIVAFWRVRVSAVAVRAMRGTAGNCSCSRFSCR